MNSESNLVAVLVATYQSAQFVEETLTSIYNQTYSPIELIITDDGSTDDTVGVVTRWLQAHQGRFLRSELLTVRQNTGVSANANRGISACRSKWIKLIAGDDILLPRCLEDNIGYLANHPETKVLFSQVRLYSERFSEDRYLTTVPGLFPMNIMDPSFTALDQYKLLLISDRINFTPSYFFLKEVVLSVGGCDESFKEVEDYPMWLKLTRNGVRLDFMLKETVGYRQHDKAANNISTKVIFKPLLLKVHEYREKNVFALLPWYVVGHERWVQVVRVLYSFIGWNKDRPLLLGLYRLLTVYLNPFQYVISIEKRWG